jgi:hypothetical protein
MDPVEAGTRRILWLAHLRITAKINAAWVQNFFSPLARWWKASISKRKGTTMHSDVPYMSISSSGNMRTPPTCKSWTMSYAIVAAAAARPHQNPTSRTMLFVGILRIRARNRDVSAAVAHDSII